MKQSEIALVILIIVLSLVTSYFVGNTLFQPPEGRSAEVEIVKPIQSIIPEPDSTIFNADAINPTPRINISESNSNQPFTNEE